MTGQLRVFSIARLPRILFGSGAFAQVAGTAARYGQRVLLVTGAHSFKNTNAFTQLIEEFEEYKIEWMQCIVDGEPSPQLVI